MNFITTIIAKIKALFIKDVASAVAGITATVKHLEEIAAHHKTQAASKAVAVASLNEQIVDHTTEAGQAASVAAKLTALVS